MSARNGGGRGPLADAESDCDVCAAENPHFAAGERWVLAGALTFESAASVLNSSREAALPKTGIVDLTRLSSVDSAAVAVLLAWQRRAASEGMALSFTGVPSTLAALAELYGVEELISRPPRVAA